MALNARPTLSIISAFDADFGTPNKENIPAPVLKFSWRDGVVRQNRVVIRDYDTNEQVYDCTITTMALKHQLHNRYDTSDKVQVITYNLQNGHKYLANVYVCTTDGEWSLPSNDVIFYCYSTPIFEFKNFTKYLGEDTKIAVVNNSSVNLNVYYKQDNGEPLSTYKFELYNYSGLLLDSSETKYSSLAEDTLRYTFGGISETEKDKYGEIIPNREYKIVCSGETQHGIQVKVEQKFIVKLLTSGVGALVNAENVGDGTVVIYSNYKIINANCSLENPTYLTDESGNPYAIDLSKGGYVEFIEGFTMLEPYEIILKGSFKLGVLITLTNADGLKGYISLKEITYTTTPFYYFSYMIERNGFVYEIRTNYFNKETDIIDAEIDVSHYQNGYHNIKAKVNGQEV